MKLANKRDALAQFESLWAGRLEAQIGRAIIEYLAANTSARYLPMNRFFEIGNVRDDVSRNAVLNVVSYLTGSDLHLLNTRFEFIEQDMVRMLDSEEAKAATQHGINPITGETDPELPEKIFICFSPTQTAKEVLGR